MSILLYAQIDRKTNALSGPIGSLPYAVASWSDKALRDLDAVDPSFGLRGSAFWPVVVTDPAFDADKEALTDEIVDPQPDPAAFVVRATKGKRALTADEIAARQPKPLSLTKLAFVTLCQKAGGMTPTLYMQARKSPDFEYLWDMLGFAEVVDRDNEFTTMALDALEAGKFMPKGAAAVKAAWPTA